VVSGEEEAPEATSPDYSTKEVLIAAAVQGAIFAVVKAAVDRPAPRASRRSLAPIPGGRSRLPVDYPQEMSDRIAALDALPRVRSRLDRVAPAIRGTTSATGSSEHNGPMLA
jgi:hypothetical protein